MRRGKKSEAERKAFVLLLLRRAGGEKRAKPNAKRSAYSPSADAEGAGGWLFEKASRILVSTLWISEKTSSLRNLNTRIRLASRYASRSLSYVCASDEICD